MRHRFNRRAAIAAAVAGVVRGQSVRAQGTQVSRSYPIGLPGRVLGDGFLIRHGYATENTWYNPGWLHCGEDWYAVDGETAGAEIYAIAAGDVVFAGFDYPGPVVIVRHAPDLFSMYGHLDAALAVEPGQRVERGTLLGTVLARTDGRAPSHLHFETRTFLTHPEVNGERPRYDVGCGYNCPPGPGYWPIAAPEHPSAIGWRNPTHLIGDQSWAGTREPFPLGRQVVVAAGAEGKIPLWSGADRDQAEEIGSLALMAGERFGVTGVETGDAAATTTSATAYRLRYRIVLADGGRGWVDAVVPSLEETGSDGRPSAVRFRFLPATETS